MFAGGWTLEAAERVCARQDLEAQQVLDSLSELVSKSLVVPRRTREGAMRYRFLETVRQYAGERLQARAEAEALSQCHAEYFLQLAEQVAPRLLDSDPALDALEHEHDNLRAALRWLVDRQQPEQAQRLGAAVGRLWFFRGHLTEGRAWLGELLAMRAGDAPTAARTELLYRLGMLAWVQGDAVGARAPLKEALRLAHQLGDAAAEAQALCGLGHLARTAGEGATARELYTRSVAVSRQSGLRRHETIALLGLGWVAHDTGDATAAFGTLGEVLTIARENSWTTLALQVLVILGDLRRQQGDSVAARLVIEQALAMAHEVGARWWIGSASLALAQVLAWQGDHARAGELAREGLAVAYELGDQPGIARGLEVTAHLASEDRDPQRALRLAGAAARLRAAVGPPLPPRDRERLERCVATARHVLGPSRSAAAWDAGCALSLEDAVASALEASPVPPRRHQPRSAGRLTAREREIAALIARGFSNRGMADELVISEATVVRHVSNILGKLNAHSRAEIAVWAVREGLEVQAHR